MGIKNKLEILMKKADLNASSLADRAGLPKSTVYALLKRDSSNISYQTAQKLAAALNCSESDILEFEQSDKEYYESLKRKVTKLTAELNDLKSIDDYIDIPVVNDEGDIDTVSQSVYQYDIDTIENELAALNFEIERLLGESKISMSPTKYAEIINYYKELNEPGRLEAVKRVEELTYIPKYKKEPGE